MTHTSDDNRREQQAEQLTSEQFDTERIDTGHIDSDSVDEDLAPMEGETPDPLDTIAAELDGLEDLDPAHAVDVLADITGALNRELDADADRS